MVAPLPGIIAAAALPYAYWVTQLDRELHLDDASQVATLTVLAIAGFWAGSRLAEVR